MSGVLITLFSAVAAQAKEKSTFDSNTLIPNNRTKIPDKFFTESTTTLTNMIIDLWTHVKGLWNSLPAGVADKIYQVESVEVQMFSDPNTRKPIPGVHFTGKKPTPSCDPNIKHVCDFGLYFALSESYGNNPRILANDIMHLMNSDSVDMNMRVPAIIADMAVFEKTIMSLMVLNNILTRVKAAFTFQATLPVDIMLALYRTEANLAVPLDADLYFHQYPSAYGYGGAQFMTGFDFKSLDNNKLGVYVIDKIKVDSDVPTVAQREANVKRLFRISWLRVFGLDILSVSDDHATKLSAIMKTNGIASAVADAEAARIITALAAISIYKNDEFEIRVTDVFTEPPAGGPFFPYYSAAPNDSVIFLTELFNIVNIVFSTYRKHICPQKLPFNTTELANPVIINTGDFNDYEFLSNTPSLLNQQLTTGTSYLNFHATGHMSAIIADAIVYAKASTSTRFAALKQSINSSSQLSALTVLDTIKGMSDYYNKNFSRTINDANLTFINNLKQPADLDSFDTEIDRRYKSFLDSKPAVDRPLHLQFIKRYLVKTKWTKIGYMTIMEIKENLWTNILLWVNADAANVPRLCDFIENASYAEWPEYNLHRANMSRFMLLQNFYHRLFLS
jgi:hypothetical protein